MKPLPFPLRVAAGLAVTAAEQARELPKNLLGLPVTVVSQVLQFSMRLQQQVTELAIKGDEALSSLRPVEETPGWATFDEDLPPDEEPPNGNNGHRAATVLREVSENARDPWEQEERALAEDHLEGEFDSGNGTETGAVEQIGGEAEEIGASGPEGVGFEPEGLTGSAGLANYDELTLPQLRARLRRFTLGQLEELLAYERAHENRPSFVGMLARRIGNVQRLSEGDNGGGPGGQ
ncbi:lipid droplet-associated protein [Amycolatopsis alkalitolerans]|uniref:Lipid droplet-associated protein n=1 Tax=Amycolatopsis alkalitolerans TaxID=2547244 RepID=A0A5C4M8B3_9PSEU|nr:lipid droplet-associated protein [Amycolatopsis alkalitolerans]TNC29635.1 lipid droplet-associated protein [Amycolatopsis alkalitolerans]